MPVLFESKQKSSPPPALVLMVLIIQSMLWFFGFMQWNLITGFIFFIFWWRPSSEWRMWALICLFASFSQSLLMQWQMLGNLSALITVQGLIGLIWANFIWLFAIILGVWYLKEKWLLANNEVTINGMSRLYKAAILTSFFLMLKDLAVLFTLSKNSKSGSALLIDSASAQMPDSLPLLLHIAASHFMNAFLGIMLIVPLLLWGLVQKNYQGSKRIIYSGLIYLYLLPLVLYLSGVLFNNAQAEFPEVLKITCLVAVMVFSFFHGWRGAALSALVVGSLMAYDWQLYNGETENLTLQLYLAVMSSMALLFGASMDELKKNEIVLKADKSQLQTALTALADSTRRGMQSEEFERKRIARELHDDMGQILTAMQTRITMTQHNDGLTARGSAPTLEHLSQKMAQSLKSVVNALSPDELDQLGLYSAITYGSPAQQCEMSGINYQVELFGNSLLLDELEPVCRLAAYRIVQEAVSNAVKHASCSNIQVRMRIWLRDENIYLFLSILDDGIGLKSLGQIKHGFYSIRDRAIALNGVLHVQNLPGVRVHVLLRQ